MNYTFASLAELDRTKLQQIAKGLGLRQNAKSSTLIRQIVAKQPIDSTSSAILCKASSPAPAQVCQAETPKAASPKEVLVQTKRTVSPAPMPAQKSSKRQRTEKYPAASAAAAVATAAVATAAAASADAAVALTNNSSRTASAVPQDDFSESSSNNSHSSECSDSMYNQLCNFCQCRLGRDVCIYIYCKRDVQGAEIVLCTATVAHS
jgi:hypothetical protein